MKYTDESKSLAAVRVLSNEIGRRIRKRAKKRQEIDIRPLDQREKPLNNRKGIFKTLIVPRGMTGEQLAFWKLTQDPQSDQEPKVKKPYMKPTVTKINPDDMEPDYIKKHKSEMI
jgi:hypothetical protein